MRSGSRSDRLPRPPGRALNDARVEYVLIGGLAGTRRNLRRLVEALRDHRPYLRGAPAGLPFQLDLETLRRGLNFTLQTSLGHIDLLGEAAGSGTYENLFADSITMEVYGQTCRVVSLRKLIDLKRAAGRPRDLEAIAELEAIREEDRGIRPPPGKSPQ